MDKFKFWLACMDTISNSKRIKAEMITGSAKEVYFMNERQLQELHIFNEKDIATIMASKNNLDFEYEITQMEKKSIRFVSWKDADYPDRLQNISDRPYALFVRGNLPDERKTVGVVGARMCSEGGRSIAELLGLKLAENNVQIISGMALGIDSASHCGSMKAHGDTFAVLGCGCDICYPRNSSNIYNNILHSDGGIISEYCPGTKPLPYRFPRRNRIISALSDVLVVVEAKEKSGSLITADFALDQGKDVFAVPGRFDDVISAGCNRLIAQGAGLIYDIDIFLENIGVISEKGKSMKTREKILLEKEHAMVYSCLDLHPKFINDIINESGVSLLNTLNILNELKKSHLVQETFQNYFSRCV